MALDQRAAGPSGCSVDALVRQMKALQQELGVELVNHAPVLFRSGSAIEGVPRDVFAEMAEQGKVSGETTVFNNTLTSLGDVRDGRWEVPASELRMTHLLLAPLVLRDTLVQTVQEVIEREFANGCAMQKLAVGHALQKREPTPQGGVQQFDTAVGRVHGAEQEDIRGNAEGLVALR